MERRYRELGQEPPIATTSLASALIAMDIGLAIQHYVDPDAAPLALYPEIFGAGSTTAEADCRATARVSEFLAVGSMAVLSIHLRQRRLAGVQAGRGAAPRDRRLVCAR